MGGNQHEGILMGKTVEWAKVVEAIYVDFPDLEQVDQADALRERLEKEFRRVYIAGQESIYTSSRVPSPHAGVVVPTVGQVTGPCKEEEKTGPETWPETDKEPSGTPLDKLEGSRE